MMNIKKCKNCMRITEYINGMCMKCGYKEGDIPTYERTAMENIAREQRATAQIPREQRPSYSAATVHSNIASIWYVIAFWMPLIGCQFAAAMLSRGEEREAEALLRIAIKGVTVWLSVIAVVFVASIIIILGVTLWGWG